MDAVFSKPFINWFGDWINDPANASKVVDENGEPLVVYHQTNETFTKHLAFAVNTGYTTDRTHTV